MVLNKPDLTAADGVSVTGSNGLFPTTFFGTSAAAPHAAAIAALIKSRPGPALTPTQIRAALMSTAIDIEAPGYDRDSGVGHGDVEFTRLSPVESGRGDHPPHP